MISDRCTFSAVDEKRILGICFWYNLYARRLCDFDQRSSLFDYKYRETVDKTLSKIKKKHFLTETELLLCVTCSRVLYGSITCILFKY